MKVNQDKFMHNLAVVWKFYKLPEDQDCRDINNYQCTLCQYFCAIWVASHCWYGFAWLLNLPVYVMPVPIKKAWVKNICMYILMPQAPKFQIGFIPNPGGPEPGNRNGAGSCSANESWKQIKLLLVGVSWGLDWQLWMYSMGFVLWTLLTLLFLVLLPEEMLHYSLVATRRSLYV